MFLQVSIKQAGDRVIVEHNGTLVFDLQWNAALALGQGIVAQARKAEETAKANQIILDQATLIRSGSSMPLSDHPKIQAEALKESRWNRTLRRFMAVRKEMPENIGQLQIKRG